MSLGLLLIRGGHPIADLLFIMDEVVVFKNHSNKVPPCSQPCGQILFMSVAGKHQLKCDFQQESEIQLTRLNTFIASADS